MNIIIEDADARPPPLRWVSKRLGYRECLQISGGFWQSFGRWGNCKNCFHARLFSCRIVFMQDCFHADCLHARLFPCKIVFMQDCLHARLFSCRLSSCKIIQTLRAFRRASRGLGGLKAKWLRGRLKLWASICLKMTKYY